jgi:DNA-binding MarR family transcriptional regulator
MSVKITEPTPSATTDQLLTVSRRLVAVAARSIAGIEADVSVVQFRALVALWEHPTRSLASLAGELDVHPSTATRLCDRLVAKGLMIRQPSPCSRREVELQLSAEGRDLVQSVIDRRRRDLMKVARRMTAEERALVLTAFEIFDRAAEAITDDDNTVPWPT